MWVMRRSRESWSVGGSGAKWTVLTIVVAMVNLWKFLEDVGGIADCGLELSDVWWEGEKRKLLP